MHRRFSLLLVLLAQTPWLPSCVPQGKYDAAAQDAQSAHTALAAALDREKIARAQIDKLQVDLQDAQSKDQTCEQALSDLTTSDHNLQAKLDEATALNAKLRSELERLGKNVDQMLRDKGSLSNALDDAKARLEELRKAQAAAEARAALFQSFVQKFKKMIDAGQLKITTRNGRLVLQLPNDVLFDSGQTAIKPAGKDRDRPGGGGLQDGDRPVFPGRGGHRQRADPDAAVPLELGALDGAGGRGRQAPRGPGGRSEGPFSGRLRGVRSGGEQRHSRRTRDVTAASRSRCSRTSTSSCPPPWCTEARHPSGHGAARFPADACAVALARLAQAHVRGKTT